LLLMKKALRFVALTKLHPISFPRPSKFFNNDSSFLKPGDFKGHPSFWCFCCAPRRPLYILLNGLARKLVCEFTHLFIFYCHFTLPNCYSKKLVSLVFSCTNILMIRNLHLELIIAAYFYKWNPYHQEWSSSLT
jgi:hypothetical protein